MDGFPFIVDAVVQGEGHARCGQTKQRPESPPRCPELPCALHAEPDRLSDSSRNGAAQLALEPGEVHVWYARAGRCSSPSLLQKYEALLTSQEHSKLESLVFERHRRELLVTRALVRSALSRYRSVLPWDWRFRRTAYGRPEVDPPCGLRFNLSNTPDFVVCAIAINEVGVDAESHARAAEVLEVASSVCSRRELERLRGLSPETMREHALTLWTLKESYAKARGLGLTIPLDALSFAFESVGPVVLDVAPSWADARADWVFRVLDIAGHRVSVTTQCTPGHRVRVSVAEMVPLADDVLSPALHAVE